MAPVSCLVELCDYLRSHVDALKHMIVCMIGVLNQWHQCNRIHGNIVSVVITKKCPRYIKISLENGQHISI